MKKSLLALAVLGAFAGAASAQSSVTLYGVVDVSVQRLKAEDQSVTREGGSNGIAGSRLGVKGVEDLGSGLKGLFVLEAGFGADTGNSLQGGRLFGRQAYVGLGGDFGEIDLGRQYSLIGALADYVGTQSLDIFTVTNSFIANKYYRLDNAVTYKSPSLYGFNVNAQYSFAGIGNEPVKGTTTSENFSRLYDVSASYSNGPISVAAAFLNVDDNDAVTPGDQRVRAGTIAGSYDFGVAKPVIYYDRESGVPKKFELYGLQVAVPLGAFIVTPGLARARHTTGADNDNATLYTLLGEYDLSKRTAIYARYLHVANDNNSRITFNDAAAPVIPVGTVDGTADGFAFGIKHSF